MSEQLKRPRVFIPFALFIVAAVVGLVLTISPAPPNAQARAMAAEGVRANDVELLMARIGADAETLAAAGLTSNEAGNVVRDAKAFLESNAAVLAASDRAVADARTEVETLRRKARSGLATQGDLIRLSTARATLDTARLAQQTMLEEARAAAFAGLSDQQKTVLRSVEQAAAHRTLGVPICAAQRSDDEWHRIRRAAGAVRSSEYSGEEPDAEALVIIDDAEGHADAITARANIEVRFAGVNAAIQTALESV